jgi:hypothetical protein
VAITPSAESFFRHNFAFKKFVTSFSQTPKESEKPDGGKSVAFPIVFAQFENETEQDTKTFLSSNPQKHLFVNIIHLSKVSTYVGTYKERLELDRIVIRM